MALRSAGKTCGMLPQTNSHWNNQQERKLLDSAVAWDSWRIDMPRNFPGQWWPLLQVSWYFKYGSYRNLTLHYFWGCYKELGFGRPIWVQIPFCHLLVMRSWADYLTLLSLFSHLRNKPPWVDKWKPSRFVLEYRQFSGYSSIYKYVIDPVVDGEHTE